MRWVILGAGAVGGVVGGHLVRAGYPALFIARGAHLEAMRANGLRIESPAGAFTLHPDLVADASEIEWEPGDVVLLAVKTQDASAGLGRLMAHAPPRVPIVCLTNGVEAERMALRCSANVYGACVMMPATHLEPGVVQFWSSPTPGIIDIGRCPDGADELGAAVSSALRAAGFVSHVRADIMRWKRGKLLMNLGNGAEALCGAAGRQAPFLDEARREATACFAAAGLTWTTPDEEAALVGALQMRSIDGAQRQGGSTWQSLARRAPGLETDYLNGEIVLLGRLHGVPTPINEALQHFAVQAARRGVAAGSVPLSELTSYVEDWQAR